MPGHGLGTRSQTESECSKQKLKLELLRGSRPKLESLPFSVVVHLLLVRAGCMFFGTTTRRTLTRLHRQFSQALFTKVEHSDRSNEGLGSRLIRRGRALLTRADLRVGSLVRMRMHRRSRSGLWGLKLDHACRLFLPGSQVWRGV